MASDPEVGGSAPGERRLLCVLGMHRSGTSAATQLLFRLGAGVGPQLLDAMGGVNEDGFWEDSRVVDLNERLLAALGSSWHDCAPLDFPADPQALAVLAEEAAAYFRVSYSTQAGASSLWTVKDPRLCRLLPFWEAIWRAEGFELCFVHVLRHPYAVAKSLWRRDRVPFEYGVVLWLRYIFDAMSHSVGRPGIVVAFDAFARDPLLVPRLLTQRCGMEWPSAVVDQEEIAASVVKQNLLHQDNELPERAGLGELMVFAAKVFDVLCSPSGDLPDETTLASLCAELQVLFARYDGELAMLRRATDEMMALSAETVRIGTLHGVALDVIKNKDNTLEETNRLFAEAVQYRDQVILARDQVILAREQTIESREETIKLHQQTLQDIVHFRFWRLVPRVVRRITRR